MSAESQALAVFDLDGTITRRDTLLPYLLGWLRRAGSHRRRLWRLPGPVLRFLLGGRDRGRLKSALIGIAMGGAPRGEVMDWSREFVAGLDGAVLCPGALAAIERHRRAGDLLVLMSASVDLYVPLIAERLGFDEVICTGVRWHGERLDGALTTPNRRAEEKRRCIDELRRRHPGAAIAAYGNAASDLAHLVAVERPLLVNAGAAARRRAAAAGIATADWRNIPAR